MGSDPHTLALVEPVGVSAFHTGIEIQEPAVGLVDSGEPESLGVLLRVDAFERRPGEMRPEFVSTGRRFVRSRGSPGSRSTMCTDRTDQGEEEGHGRVVVNLS